MENIEKSKFFNKRIKRDVESLFQLYPHNKLYTDNSLNHIIINIYENKNDNENNSIYKFIIKKYYPFSSPDVYYKNLPYENVYKITSQREQKYLYLLTKKECLCCESVLCSNNWNITLNFFDIIKEINNYRKIKKNIFIKILADKIKDKYLVNDIDLDGYLFGI
jgi:hypothetical protein